MRSLLCLAIWAVAAHAAPPTLEVPAEVTAVDGLFLIEPVTTARAVAYVPLDGARGKVLSDRVSFAGSVGTLPPGRYRFTAVATDKGETAQKTVTVVVPDPMPMPPGPAGVSFGLPVTTEAGDGLRPPTTEAVKATCTVGRRGHAGSGTCIACDGKQSVVLTNNHIFSDQPRPGAQFPTAPTPQPATVRPRDSDREYPGTVVHADADADLAVVVADVVMPAVELGDDPAPGLAVRHYGIGSGGGPAKVLAPPASPHGFAYSSPSRSGDSGAGVFDGSGRLVAVHWGHEAERARGTPVGSVRTCLLGCRGGILDRLRARIQAKRAAAVPLAAPAVIVPAVPLRPPAPQRCPGGTCPQRTSAAPTPITLAAGTYVATGDGLLTLADRDGRPLPGYLPGEGRLPFHVGAGEYTILAGGPVTVERAE